jgi:GT2 family glycosyltransferase
MNRRSPRCSIVIPVHNQASLTRQCLEILLTTSTPHVDFEVIVVDDGSTDTTPTVLNEFAPLIRVVKHPEPQGFAAAANEGATQAVGEFVVFLNNDTMPEHGWLDELVRYAEAHSRAAVVGSKLLYPNETIQHAGVVITSERIPRHIYLGFPGDHPAANKSRRFRAVTAACMLVRHRDFETLGGFDEAFKNGYEDIDFCLRLGERGAEVHYCHKSVLYHLEKATRGLEAPSDSHDLFVKRWPHLDADDLQYYIADGLLRLTYRDHYPIKLYASPSLASVNVDDREHEADRILATRARQVFELLQENTRLRIGGSLELEQAPSGAGLSSEAVKAVLFLSGAPGDPMRYRCHHQAEALALTGVTSDVSESSKVGLGDVLDRYEIFVLHRVPYGHDVDWFIREAHVLGKRVIFDTDDLVFDPDVVRHVAALEDMQEAERSLYSEGLSRYRETLQKCDAVIVTTEPLRAFAEMLHSSVFVVPNVVSDEMVELSDAALRGRNGDVHTPKETTIAYFSGTKTHNRDFAEAASAVLYALDRWPETRLVIVGLLELDDRFEPFADRITRLPIQPWRRLPELLADTDVNLAPLEPHNPFTDSKSCIKYLEAGLVAVPTIASARPDFKRVITHERNGLLVDNQADWKAALAHLLDAPERRRELGCAARDDVHERHTTFAGARKLHDIFRALGAPESSGRGLIVNFVLEAPIAQTSGGYRNIARLTSHLTSSGHHVRLYVNPVAHLEGLSTSQILAFMEESFGDLGASIHVRNNTDEIFQPADVSIATFWSTAPAVANHNKSLFKAYYVQDFEPEFYEEADPYWQAALATYELPLLHICLGRSLAQKIEMISKAPSESIDFALDPEFTVTAPPESRGSPPSILFFARPALKRRGYGLGVTALRLIKERFPDTRILFFGSRTQELGEVPFDFENLGVLSPARLARAMNRAQVLLTVSLSNISNVTFEGMACGCAVVEIDHPGNAQMVEAGSNCLLADADPEAMAAALAQLVADESLRHTLATNGARDMRPRTWERTGGQFEAALMRQCFARLPHRLSVEEPVAPTTEAIG